MDGGQADDAFLVGPFYYETMLLYATAIVIVSNICLGVLCELH
jgi:hypothetical protein